MTHDETSTDVARSLLNHSERIDNLEQHLRDAASIVDQLGKRYIDHDKIIGNIIRHMNAVVIEEEEPDIPDT